MRLTAALAMTAGSGSAFADAFQSLANQRSVLPGGRASMLGGAFTAVADDPSATYYNPGGLAFAKENKLEVSANAYQTSEIEYKNTVNDQPFHEHSETFFPSFIGGTARAGWLTVGYSFMTLDTRNIYQQDKYAGLSSTPGAASSYGRTYQETSTYIWTGGSAAVKLGDHLAFGASVFYYQRNIEFSTNEQIGLGGGGILAINDTLKTLNTGVAESYGLIWQNGAWSLGACVRMSEPLSNRSVLLVDQVTYDPTGTDSGTAPAVTSESVKYKPLDELNPTTYAVGAAWHPAPFFLLTGDFLVHEGVKSPYTDQGGFDLHTTYNYSAGAELSSGPVSLMLGYFTNNSMYRKPDPDRSDQPVHIDFRGETVGLGWDVGSFHGQLGMVRQTGKGQAQIRSGDKAVQDVVAETNTYVISGKVPL